MVEDNTWYVAITGFSRCYFSLVAAGNKSYRNFAEHFNKAGGSKIIAEQFDVSPEIVDKIAGFDKFDKKPREIF